MHAGRTTTWATRAIWLGLFVFALGLLAAILAMQDAFAVVVSEDPTNKARLLADAIIKAERIKTVQSFHFPIGIAALR